jgi:nicotinamidase-related amidase
VVEKARQSHVPVIWVQHSEEQMPIGSPGWQIVPELLPLEREQVVQKTYRSSFDETNLEEILAAEEVGKLFICGAETNFCIRSTSYAALERGYDITLISDSHTAWNGSGDDIPASVIISEQNSSFDGYQLSGRSASIADAAEVAF